MTQDQWMKEAERLADEYALAAWDCAKGGSGEARKERVALFAHLQQRPLPVREGSITAFELAKAAGTKIAPILRALNAGGGDFTVNQALTLKHIGRALAAPSLPAREEPTPVLNALQVLERMDYRPGDRVLVEHFLSVLWARGMWVIESPLAASPSVQNMGEGETGKDGVGGTDGR